MNKIITFEGYQLITKLAFILFSMIYPIELLSQKLKYKKISFYKLYLVD